MKMTERLPLPAWLFVIPAILMILAPAPAINAQTADRTLHVQTTGEVEVPADQILFSIQIQIESDTPQKAFRQHRDREAYLARLIKNSGIQDSQISYQPVRISSIDRRRPGTQQSNPEYRTNQQVRLRLNDFALFDTMQVKLIDHGFDSFSARFQSSQSKEGRRKALDKALSKAREKARQIARQMDISLGPIQHINYSSANDGPVYRGAESMSISSDSMMDFEQSLTISESVSVTYYIDR